MHFVLQDTTVERLTLTYAYLWKINRVFGDALDWDSDSHLMHASYSGLPFGTLAGYAHLLDFDRPASARGSSTATYGLSFAGATASQDPCGASLTLYFGGHRPSCRRPARSRKCGRVLTAIICRFIDRRGRRTRALFPGR
jgi:hypothetical protein